MKTLTPSLDAHLAQVTHARGALTAAIVSLLEFAIDTGHPIVILRHGQQGAVGTLRFAQGFYMCGRHIFTADKVGYLHLVNGFLNVVLI